MNGRICRRFTLMLLGVLLWLPDAAPAAQQLARQELQDRVRQLVQQELDLAGEGLRVVGVTCQHDLRLTEGEITLDTGEGLGRAGPGKHTLPVTVMVNGKTEATASVSMTVRQLATLPILTRNLERGEMLKPGDVEWREQELSRPLSGLISAEREVEGKVVNRMVRAGQPARSEWFEAPVVVARGDRVKVTLAYNGLSIETSGVAVTQGRVGENVQLRNPRSNKVFAARVVGSGEAVVER